MNRMWRHSASIGLPILALAIPEQALAADHVASGAISLHPVTIAILLIALTMAGVALTVLARRSRLATDGAALAGGTGEALLGQGPAPFGPVSARVSDKRASSAGAVFDTLPVALLELDLKGRVTWSNRAARQLLGGAPKRGEPIERIFESLGAPVSAMLTAAVSDQRRGRSEMVRLAASERDVFLQVALSRASIGGRDGLIAVLSDASEMRQLEDQFAQSQKMEAVGKLAGGVAHDFNNLLTAISGHCDLLLLGKDISHPDYSDLMQVRQNSNRAASLVRQLLAFSRKQTLAPEILSVRDVISEAHYMLDRVIGDSVRIRLEHGSDLGAVRADQQQLEQALMNLVVNARDAMPEGGTITVETSNRSFDTETVVDQVAVAAGDYVEIIVGDEGSGIPAEVLPRVFDPFFTTKPLGQGTGLGLSTVYGIVKQSGGYVTVANGAGGDGPTGACFRILLPRVEPARPAPEQAAPAVIDRPDMTGIGSVLLVEDEAPVRSFASRALTLRGYRVEACESAETAMEFLRDSDNPVDLIVSDVMMPGMDGPTFASEARKMRPEIPVVFISGYAEASFRKRLPDHDFLFLPKPFSLAELTAKVKEALT